MCCKGRVCLKFKYVCNCYFCVEVEKECGEREKRGEGEGGKEGRRVRKGGEGRERGGEGEKRENREGGGRREEENGRGRGRKEQRKHDINYTYRRSQLRFT